MFRVFLKDVAVQFAFARINAGRRKDSQNEEELKPENLLTEFERKYKGKTHSTTKTNCSHRERRGSWIQR